MNKGNHYTTFSL